MKIVARKPEMALLFFCLYVQETEMSKKLEEENATERAEKQVGRKMILLKSYVV